MREGIGRHGFDAFVGSDQVWRPKYAGSVLDDLCLGFLPEDDDRTRRVSYAASFGADEWEYGAPRTETAARRLRRFHAVSVREDRAVDMCREKFGVEAQQVLDPTLLLPPAHHAGLHPEAHPGRGGLVTYVLDGNADKSRMIQALSTRPGERAGPSLLSRLPQPLRRAWARTADSIAARSFGRTVKRSSRS